VYEARIVLAVCDRFRCTPDEALRMDATVIGLMSIEDLMGWRRQESAEGGEYYG